MWDVIANIVVALSHWFLDAGFPLPCWDVIAEAGGVCR